MKKNKLGRKSGTTSVRFNTGMRHMNGMYDMHDMKGRGSKKEEKWSGNKWGWCEKNDLEIHVLLVSEKWRAEEVQEGNTTPLPKDLNCRAKVSPPEHCSSHSLTQFRGCAKGRAERKAKQV